VNLVRVNPIVVFIILAIMEAFLVPGPGRTQDFASGEFTLAQGVRWENSVLPVGDYVYFVESNTSPQVVRVEQKGGGFSGVFTAQTFMRRESHGIGGIVLSFSGMESYVSSIIVRSLGEELIFSAPGEAAVEQTADPVRVKKPDASSFKALDYITIFNPRHEKMSPEEAEKVYLKACEVVEAEFNRPVPVRPHLTLRLGAGENALRYATREILLKKWDEFRFADTVVDLALFDMVPRDERAKLSNAAIRIAGATVNVCELKVCVN